LPQQLSRKTAALERRTPQAAGAPKAQDAPLLHSHEGFWLTDATQARERA
jgi:hypothetical protein